MPLYPLVLGVSQVLVNIVLIPNFERNSNISQKITMFPEIIITLAILYNLNLDFFFSLFSLLMFIAITYVFYTFDLFLLA